jgi:hypothetical protein
MRRFPSAARTTFYNAPPYTQRVNNRHSRSCSLWTPVGMAAVLPGLWLAGAGASAREAASAGVVLASGGRPVATIAVPAGARPADRRAAEILRDAVRAMSGATLPIAEKARPGRDREVAIGFAGKDLPGAVKNSAAGLGDDGFLVATAGGSLYIVSGGDKGAIYGVVHLLETYLGCRVFSPTVRVFPARDTLVLPRISDRDAPANRFRVVNGEFSRDADYRDWQRLDATDEVFGRGYYVHTFNRLVPWERYFDEHPEYFAWMNGKRVKDQLCPSRPEVLEISVARLEAEIAAQPDRHVWSVSQNDNASYCQCDLCRRVIEAEGSPAGPIIRFVNAVAARFQRQTISTLAYQYSRQAPRVTKPASNVQVMLCTIELNRSLPIATDPGSEGFRKDIADWSRITRNIYLWDYVVNFSHHVSPFPNLRVLQPNLQFFASHGVGQHFQQANTSPGHEFSELKSYLLARLLWNPAIDAGAVVNEFLEGYYGAAAPWIARYIEGLDAALSRSGATLDIYEPPVAHADDYLSLDKLKAFNQWFDKAEEAASADAERLQRVKTARLPLQYAMIEIGKNDMFGPPGFHVERNGRFEIRPEMRQLVEDFRATSGRNGVKTLNEAGLTPGAYYQATLRFLDVQVEENLAFRRTVTANPPPSRKYARGDVALLTNGVRGAADFKVHWLGWEGPDFDLVVDLGAAVSPTSASIGTLWDQRSWILHPRRVSCAVSADGVSFEDVGTRDVGGDQRNEEVTRTFSFPLSGAAVRFVRFRVEGTHQLPAWHPSAGGTSWVFVDEVVVR